MPSLLWNSSRLGKLRCAFFQMSLIIRFHLHGVVPISSLGAPSFLRPKWVNHTASLLSRNTPSFFARSARCLGRIRYSSTEPPVRLGISRMVYYYYTWEYVVFCIMQRVFICWKITLTRVRVRPLSHLPILATPSSNLKYSFGIAPL